MKNIIKFSLYSSVILALVIVSGCAKTISPEQFQDLPYKYNVRIMRDTWGVPHIFGESDPDVAFGLAYAHAEDDYQTIEGTLLAARGKLASVYGPKAAPNDYMVHLLRVWDVVNARYESDLSPETKALCNAYADGLNYYAYLHPRQVHAGLYPARGIDVVAGFVHKVPLFFDLDKTLIEIFNAVALPDYTKQDSTRKSAWFTDRSTLGSNTFGISPRRSARGETFFAINSHQPWEGPVAWYEIHLHSNEGWDMVGGTFPGAPTVLHGHNRNLGWAHTVNRPDLQDVYVLEINPDNPNQYRFDGQWRDLEIRQAPIEVKILGPIHWTFKKEVLWSVYGPVIRRPHATYALRYAAFGMVRQVEQWYRMNKAVSFDEWFDAMRIRAIPCFNCGYADREGNICYLYNALIPQRPEIYDWSEYLPGNTSKTLWKEYIPFEELPMVKNPESGIIINSNSTPFRATIGDENPDPADYSKTCGIETHLTNRARRLLELLGADESITEDEFTAYKYDMSYSTQSKMAAYVQRLLAAPLPDDDIVQEAAAILKAWDLRTNPENTGAAIAMLSLRTFLDDDVNDVSTDELIEHFVAAAYDLKEHHGRIDVPWQNVNRLIRGDVDLGLGGGPDILHAVWADPVKGARLRGKSGDSYVLLATWDKNGKVHSRSIHQYGSATLDKTSPHYDDQAPLFVKRQLKKVWMDEAEIRAHLEREYRPGEEIIP